MSDIIPIRRDAVGDCSCGGRNHEHAPDCWTRDKSPSIPDSHPEAFCQECGRRNVVWFAPSDIWNATMGGGQGILCPVCFIEAAESAGLFGPWIVAPGYSVQKIPGGEHSRGSVPTGEKK